MKYLLLLAAAFVFASCLKFGDRRNHNYFPAGKVWGSRPVYASYNVARQVKYYAQKKATVYPGNIYAYNNYIFQIDNGRGIHVIDNSDPAKADRIGFISVFGCEQISIKGSYLYTNSLDDLVTIDISNPANVHEAGRVPGAFPDFRYSYRLTQPEESGYYTCPAYDSVVVGWVKDSIYQGCYKIKKQH